MTETEPTPPNEPDRAAEPIRITDSPVATATDDPRPTAARTLVVMAPIVQFGLIAIGVLYSLDTLNSLSSESSYTPTQRFTIRTNAVVSLVYYGLLGWVSAGLLKGAAAAIGALVDQARAAERTTALVEGRLASALDRLTEALERAPASGAIGSSPGIAHAKEQLLAEFRAAIEASQWHQAGEMAETFTARYPDDPQSSRLGTDLAEAKQEATHNLLARIDAAREVNDPVRVLDLRDLLVPLLAAEALRSLDRELAKWCMGLIQKRLRTGTMGVDVATLAARVAESLDTTTEGASLRAALPTLRRSAGLCARCAKPYTGIEDACPACLHANGEMRMASDEVMPEEGMTEDEHDGE